MEPRRKFHGRRLACAIPLVLSGVIAAIPAQADGVGFEVSSTLGKCRVVRIVSTEGVISTLYKQTDPTTPELKVIVRYSSGEVWGIDFNHREYVATNLAAQFEIHRSDLGRAMNAQKAGLEESRSTTMQGTLRRLPDSSRIGNFRLRAYGLIENNREWRLWYAIDLPSPNGGLKKEFATLMPIDRNSMSIAPEIAGRTLVRAEVRMDGAWKPLINTEEIRLVSMKTAEFAPPTDFRLVANKPSASDATTIKFAAALSANAQRGPGPVTSNPELHVVFWGKILNQNPAPPAMQDLLDGINVSVSANYIKYLSQYGIESAKIAAIYHRSSDPSRDVGNANFAAISAMVYDVGFNSGGPLFWWTIGGTDPIYALLVAENSVDQSIWTGYHFLAFSLTHLVLPFPLSLFAHDGMPWLIVKVPDNALSLPFEGIFERANCAGDAFKKTHPDLCSAINSMSDATHRFSHEFVEAAVDPYPFWGWLDPGKAPVWLNGELADICEGKPLPWSESTQVASTIVSTYWSNADSACMPESRPTVQIFEPVAGQVLTAGVPVVLRGWANDPIDGPIPEKLSWQVDGIAAGLGGTVSAGLLTPGLHQISASIHDSQGLSTSDLISISLSAQAPKAIIFSPPDGASFGADQSIVFRGGGFDFQQGDLPSSSLSWSVDGQALGNGAQLSSKVSAEGNRVIRLAAMNSFGQSSSTAITIHIVPPAGYPSVEIMQPVNNAAFAARNPDGSLSDHSQIIMFSAKMTDSNGKVIPAAMQWISDIDGLLGTGANITHPLRGGPCGITSHRITVTATDTTGKSVTDTIIVSVGQIC